MNSIPVDDEKLKTLLKEAMVNVLKERNDLLCDAIAEVVEEIGARDSNVDCTEQEMREFKVMRYAEYPRVGTQRYEKGFLQVTLSHWAEFSEMVQKLQNYRDYIWRGHRSDGWSLVSGFDRLFPNQSRKGRQARLTEHLKRFRFAMRGRRGPNPPKVGDWRCWALGQHYGLISPLLDWTDSPYVAAYFAFIKKGRTMLSDELLGKLQNKLDTDLMNKLKEELKASSQTEYRSVFALNRDLVRWGWAESEEGPVKERFVRFVDDMSNENPRLVSQGGLFTISLDGADIKERVQRCYSWNPGEDRIILMEIRIPDKDREECLRYLNQMNISHLSLFPDLYGSARSCNLKLEIEDY